MNKSFFSLLLLVLALIMPKPSKAQQEEFAPSFHPLLSLEPFLGLNYSLITTQEQEDIKQHHSPGGEPVYSRYYAKDKHQTTFGLKAGLRTRLQFHEKWGVQAETAVEQLIFRRTLYQEHEYGGNIQSMKRESDIRVLYFYQSLEGSYQFSEKLRATAGGYAGTLLSSYQEWPLFVPEGGFTTDQEEVKKAGYGLRDTQLGLQVSLSYQFYRAFTATASLRQSLQSVYSEEAQPAGSIKPTSFSLTIGYKLQVN